MRRQTWLAFGVLFCGACQRPSPPASSTAPDPPVSDLVQSLERLLHAKDTVYPYFAEYELALPPAPHIATVQERRRIVAAGPDMLYSEEVAETWSSRVQIRGGALKLAYSEDRIGDQLFRGAAPLNGATAEEFLLGRHFATNTWSPLDHALVATVSKLLEGAVVLGDQQLEGARQVTLATRSLGNVRLTVGAGVFQMQRADAQTSRRTLFKYQYAEGMPAWSPDPIVEFERTFASTAADNVRELPATFSFADLFTGLNAETGMQPIPLPRLPDVAQRLGYFLPAGEQVVIEQASGVTADIPLRLLDLTITRHGGETISISQHIPPLRRSDLPDGLVRQERQSGEFLVADVVDPGTNGSLIYYFGKEVSFIIPDERFEDSQLDAIVLGFRRSRANEP
jgi:hypothetical protein